MAMAPCSMSATARLRKRKLYTVRSFLFHRIATITRKLPVTAKTETVIMKMDVKMVSREYEAIFSETFLSFKLIYGHLCCCCFLKSDEEGSHFFV